jgi:hypothetical protein
MSHIPRAWKKCIILLSQVFLRKSPKTNLESVAEGGRGPAVARSFDEQVSGFISVQHPTATVKVEAGMGMVT